MRFTVNRDVALAAVGFARGASARRATIPILSSVRLTSGENSLRFVGSDLDVQATISADADVSADGDVALDAERLYGALSSLPAGAEISFALDTKTGRLAIQCGRSRFQIPTEKGADFPSFSEIVEPVTLELRSADLVRLLDATEFAVARDQSRQFIAGIHFHAEAGGLRAIGTNGAVLSLSDANGDFSQALAQTIPLRAVGLLREVAKAGEAVTITQGAALFCAASGRLSMATKIIDLSFPDYKRIIPDPPASCTLPREAFSRAVSRAMAVSEAKVPGVRVDIAVEETLVSARGERGEEAQDAFAAEAEQPFTCLFNGRYLSDVADSFDGEGLTLRYSDERSPVIFSSSADPSRLAVLIGLRT